MTFIKMQNYPLARQSVVDLTVLPNYGNYQVIAADNPWTFQTYSKKGESKAPQKHYKTMSIEDIKAIPVAQAAAKDCILLLWVYQPLLPEAIEVMKAWGFEYKTIAFIWNKLTKNGKRHMSTGYYTRAGCEIVLLGRRGNPPRPKDRGVRQVFDAVVREHSRKPDEFYWSVEKLYDGPRLDLFSRQKRAGWDCYGDEVEKF